MKQKFIVFEGIECSGKTTQIKHLADRLSGMDKYKERYVVHKEPTNSPIGKMIRELYLSGVEEAHPRVLAALFQTDRLDHILQEDGLRAQLRKGKIVLQDRYYLSSIAYDASTMYIQKAIDISRPCISLLRPDLTIFLDIPVEVAVDRLQQRKGAEEIYDNLECLKKIYRGYSRGITQLMSEGEHIVKINGTLKEEVIKHAVWDLVCPLIHEE
jgi:dTMP kinase